VVVSMTVRSHCADARGRLWGSGAIDRRACFDQLSVLSTGDVIDQCEVNAAEELSP